MKTEKELEAVMERISNSIGELAYKPDEKKDVCPKCNGTGWIETTEAGIRYAEECTCRLKEKDAGGRPDWYIQGQQAGKW